MCELDFSLVFHSLFNDLHSNARNKKLQTHPWSDRKLSDDMKCTATNKIPNTNTCGMCGLQGHAFGAACRMHTEHAQWLVDAKDKAAKNVLTYGETWVFEHAE